MCVCVGWTDMVSQRAAHKAGRGEGSPELGEGDGGVSHLPRRWDPVHTWCASLHRFHSGGKFSQAFSFHKVFVLILF